MKKRLSAAVLAVALLLSLLPGTALAGGPPDTRTWDLSAGPGVLPTVQGNSGTYDGIAIDATAPGSKFAPRDAGDTQINAGTVLTIPVAANDYGAVLTFTLSGGTATVSVGETTYESANKTISIDLPAQTDGTCVVSFTTQAYLSAISLSYSAAPEEYPGDPGEVAATDISWNLAAGTDALPLIQNTRGEFQGIKIDATASGSKFSPRDTDTQINGGTILYLPVAANEHGATLTLALSGGTANVVVNGTAYSGSGAITVQLEAQANAAYCAVSFTAQAYLSGISLSYSGAPEAYPGDPGEVSAADTSWNLAAGTAVLPLVQNVRGEFQGMKIDATGGKFAPRDTGDTQITGGTTLYLPVAPDAQGGTITVSGNNYNNLTVTLNGNPIQVGSETKLPAVDEPTYLALSFSGTGSCYLTGISIDYFSDTPQAVPNTVTVGHGAGYDYASIQAALDANPSSAEAPLVLLIAPGTYTEKVTVSKPWVTFQALDPDGDPVVIEESYYSSNRYNAQGEYWPVDDYDVGTAKCGTVIIEASAANFTAVGITFQNSYNITDHTGEGEQTPAVALHTKADKVYLKDCTLLGRQDTLYVQGAGCRVYAENCLIEGTVDFIFGDADAWFSKCTLHMAAFTGRDTGYFTAPNTKQGYTGLVFENCTLTVDPSYAKENGETKVSLGRPWQNECWQELGTAEDGSSYVISHDPDKPREGYENVSSAATFLGCTMDGLIKSDRWNLWTRKDAAGKTIDVTYHPTVRFAEYNSVDTEGKLLAVPGEITLGSMDQNADLATLTEQLKADMKLDLWLPSAPEVTLSTITLDPNGGAVSPTILFTEADGTLSALPTPTREGYRFDGWFNAAEGGDAVTAGAVFTADATLYAHWTYIGTSSGGGSSSGGSSGGGSSVTRYTITASAGEGGSISPSGSVRVDRGDSVTFTITPDTDNTIDDVRVDGESVGAVEEYTFTNVRSNHTIDVSFLEEITDTTPPLAPIVFPDVQEGDWYYEAVTALTARGLLSGNELGYFAPNDTLTRAMMVQILYNLAGKPEADFSAVSYWDVSPDAWYADAVAWATAEQVTSGVGDGAFGPDRPVTRQELAALLWRCAGQPQAASLSSAFPDAGDVEPWALEAMGWAVEQGILHGYEDGSLAPRGQATRAEAAQMLYQYCK